MFTSTQKGLIVRDYAVLKSKRKVAKKWNCSDMTILRILREMSAKMELSGGRSRMNIPMIMHDWNANVSICKITDTYGFASEESAYHSIKKWRNIGWSFRRRDRVLK